MGKCVYCGENAGIFKTYHAECNLKHEEGIEKLKFILPECYKRNFGASSLPTQIQKIVTEGMLTDLEKEGCLKESFASVVEIIFEDGVLSIEEEERVVSIIKNMPLNDEIITSLPSYLKIAQGAILRKLTEGEIPTNVQLTSPLPINLEKNESIVYVFTDSEFHELRTRTSYVGGSTGISVRVAKGVYLRSGAFKGNPVETQEMKHLGTGLLCIASKNLYFYSSQKSVKIPYKKILVLEPYSNGIGVQKDNQTAKPQVFTTGDGWFAYNAVRNLMEMNK